MPNTSVLSKKGLIIAIAFVTVMIFLFAREGNDKSWVLPSAFVGVFGGSFVVAFVIRRESYQEAPIDPLNV